MVCCEVDDTPLDVIPLASSFSLLEERGDGNQLILDVEPPLSDWVLGKYKAFGEYVGASYEGYEPEILALLKSIDSRRPKQGREEGVQKQIGKSGGRGSRVLKNLVSFVNYFFDR